MIDEEMYEKLLANYYLLCGIMRQAGRTPELKVDLSKIEGIINKKIPETLGKNAPEDFYTLYIDFKSEYEKFRDFILYDRLIGKNIIALGGGFSSGKSSFLNAIMGRNVLPSDIDPSTSVPTYIVRGDKHEVVGINVFDAIVQMQPRDIKKIAHGFGEVTDEDDEKVTDSVTLGHILESIFFSTPLHKYENVVFLDTPGYSKPDSEKYSAKTDEQIARGQLNSSNYILWFVQADAGTITEEDIKFIRTLREDIPKLIVVNKADKKNLTDLKEIISKIRTSLDLKGIRYTDICAFTSKEEQICDSELSQFLKEESDRLRGQIEAWNSRSYESNFARNFKIIFVRCKDYLDDKIEEESFLLSKLNQIDTNPVDEIDTSLIESIRIIVEKTKRTLKELKEVKEQLTIVQNNFFTEIKRVADVVEIDMPEPTEIELVERKGYSFLDVKGTDYDYIKNMIVNRLENGDAQRQEFGGDEYIAYVSGLIRRNLNI